MSLPQSPSVFISLHQSPSVSISLHQSPSVSMRLHQSPWESQRVITLEPPLGDEERLWIMSRTAGWFPAIDPETGEQAINDVTGDKRLVSIPHLVNYCLIINNKPLYSLRPSTMKVIIVPKFLAERALWKKSETAQDAWKQPTGTASFTFMVFWQSSSLMKW